MEYRDTAGVGTPGVAPLSSSQGYALIRNASKHASTSSDKVNSRISSALTCVIWGRPFGKGQNYQTPTSLALAPALRARFMRAAIRVTVLADSRVNRSITCRNASL